MAPIVNSIAGRALLLSPEETGTPGSLGHPVEIREIHGPWGVVPCGVTRVNEVSRPRMTAMWAKLGLADALLEKSGLRASRATERVPPGRLEVPKVSLIEDELGCPLLELGGLPGPAISFSRRGPNLWGVIATHDGRVGIDAASPLEFTDSYPMRRAFSSTEREQLSLLGNGRRSRGAALFWSVKEAAVKALGCAFQWLDPLDLAVRPISAVNSHVFSEVRIMAVPRLGQVSMRVEAPLQAVSVRQGTDWISLVLLESGERTLQSDRVGE